MAGTVPLVVVGYPLVVEPGLRTLVELPLHRPVVRLVDGVGTVPVLGERMHVVDVVDTRSGTSAAGVANPGLALRRPSLLSSANLSRLSSVNSNPPSSASPSIEFSSYPLRDLCDSVDMNGLLMMACEDSPSSRPLLVDDILLQRDAQSFGLAHPKFIREHCSDSGPPTLQLVCLPSFEMGR